MSNSPGNARQTTTGRAIIVASAVLTLVAMACSTVLGIEFSPLRLVGRITILSDAGGSWGSPWESLSRSPAEYQQDAIATMIRTTIQLGVASVLIASFALVMHAVSRVLTMWRSLAIRVALGATSGSLMALVGGELARLALAGCAIGAGAGVLALAGLSAIWPALFARPPFALGAITAAAGAAAFILLLLVTVAYLLLVILQRGVRTVSLLHGTQITSGGRLLLIQSSLAILQLAALLMVTYGATTILGEATASTAISRYLTADSSSIAPLSWPAPAGGPFDRADRFRAALPEIDIAADRNAVASPDAWLAMGKQLAMVSVCPDCRIGPYLIPSSTGTVRMIAVAPGALRARNIGVGGRHFTGADTLGASRVAILNEEAIRKLYPGMRDPTGLSFRPGLLSNIAYTVVGITTFSAPPVLGNESQVPVVFVPILQHPPATGEAAARGSNWDGVRGRLAAMASDAPSFGNPRPLSERMSEFIDPITFFSTLFAGLAGSATGIAAYSLVAVMIQMVALRERDIAIRMAVGAQQKQIERWVVTRSVWMTTIGIVIGFSGARGVGVMLHGPNAQAESDILWLLTMSLAFGAMGIVASWIPARRAAKVEPMVVWAKVE